MNVIPYTGVFPVMTNRDAPNAISLADSNFLSLYELYLTAHTNTL